MYTLQQGYQGFEEARLNFFSRFTRLTSADPIADLYNEELVADQCFITKGYNTTLYDYIAADEISGTNETVTKIYQDLVNINQIIDNTHIIYAESNSKQKANMEKIIQNTQAIVNLQERMRTDYKNTLINEITQYNENLQNARDVLIQKALRKLAEKFNETLRTNTDRFGQVLYNRAIDLNNAAYNRFYQLMEQVGDDEEAQTQLWNRYSDANWNYDSGIYDQWDAYQVYYHDSYYDVCRTSNGGMCYGFDDVQFALMTDYLLSYQINYDPAGFNWHIGRKDLHSDEIINLVNDMMSIYPAASYYIQGEMRLDEIFYIQDAYYAEREGVENA